RADAERGSLAARRRGIRAHVAPDRVLRADLLSALAHGSDDAPREAGGDEARLVCERLLGGRRRRRGGEGRAPGGRRLSPPPEAIRTSGCARAEGHPSVWPARDGQDAA